MNECEISLAACPLMALGSGALHWPAQKMLVVSDLHLGKSERIARRGGMMLPPYETQDTLTRLEADIAATGAQTVVCLGDSFDDHSAALSLPDNERLWIMRLQAGRRWIWIEGNHDPGPLDFGGTYLAEFSAEPLVLRHIAQPGASFEISGHYHPKVTLPTRGRLISRPAFLYDSARIILPSYGTYTGGLRADDPVFDRLLEANAHAILLGQPPQRVPLMRSRGL